MADVCNCCFGTKTASGKLSECAVLNVTVCPEKCSFRKTAEEFAAAKERAEQILESKKLTAVITGGNRRRKMSVKPTE